MTREKMSYDQLSAEWLRAEREIGRLSQELNWYANDNNWSQPEFDGENVLTPAERDRGSRARIALYGGEEAQ